MEIIKILKFVGTCVLLFSILPNAFASDAKQDIVYELKPRTNEVKYGEIYYIDYYVKNSTFEDITICLCEYRGEIIFGKLDESNQASLSIDRFHTTEEPNNEDFIVIPANSHKKFSWGGFGPEYFKSPGKWILKIRESFNPVATPAGNASWSGTLESPFVNILVTKQISDENTP